MSAEHGDMLPAALEMSYGDRVKEYVTNRQYKVLFSNLQKEGIVSQLGGAAIEGQEWSGYMQVMDGVIAAESELSPADPASLTNTLIRFESGGARDAFHDLSESILAGVHGVHIPRLRADGPRSLQARNFAYSDVSTLGRSAAALFDAQFGKDLGRMMRLVRNARVGAVIEQGVLPYMPEELQQRAARHQNYFGEQVVREMLLSGGHISIIGMAMREVLNGNKLKIQRPRGERPHIEDKLTFYSSGQDIPLSGTTVRGTLKGQMHELFSDFWTLWKRREYVKAGQELWGLVEDLGMAKGVGAVVRAGGTVVVANTVATWGAVTDKRLKKRLAKGQS